MAKVIPTTALLPIFNGPSTPFSICEGLEIVDLDEKDVRFLQENSPENFDFKLEVGQKALLMKSPHFQNKDKTPKEEIKSAIERKALIVQFVFNLTALEDPLQIPFAFLIGQEEIRKVKSIFEFETINNSIFLQKNKYSIAPTFVIDDIRHLFTITEKALNRKRGIYILLKRFNSSLLKTNYEDKIIDLAIALEGLIKVQVEISFRFSYYLSLLVESDIDKRKKAKDLFKSLYDSRSALVHGDDSRRRRKKVESTIESLPDIIKLSKSCLYYYIAYESEERETEWVNHLDALSYGENLITA